MASSYLPVETVLKVEDNELLLEESDKPKPPEIISPFNSVSIGTQCDWKFDQPESKSCTLLPESERSETELSVMEPDSLIIPNKSLCDSSMVIRGWSDHSDSSILSDQKIFMPTTFSQQVASSMQSDEEKLLHQLDYKTRNKFKTKQRRQDPFYRSQERVRQRAVMRIKRQDPEFREAEREKGRYRMRLKRLDPEFRSQERERQRERMKAKRSDPEFREREREQQKTRLHVKRLDPAFKERERAQDRIRMRLKRQNNSLFANLHAGHIRDEHESENMGVTSDKMLKDMCKSEDDSREEFQNQTVFPENVSAKLLSLKPRESGIETFHFKKQQILNFNFYNTNKEQWTQDFCTCSIPQPCDNAECDNLQSDSVAEDTGDVMKKLPIIFKKEEERDESSSESLENNKSSELSLGEIRESNSSHITMSANNYSPTNTEQWTQDFCTCSIPQPCDNAESDNLQSDSVTEVTCDVMKKMPILFKKEEERDESSSESLENNKSSELSLGEIRESNNSSHITMSASNYSPTNTEQWTQEFCTCSIPQPCDNAESDNLQSDSVTEVTGDVMKKLPIIFKKKEERDESSSESLENNKSSELSLGEIQEFNNSSHITMSANNYSPTNTEN